MKYKVISFVTCCAAALLLCSSSFECAAKGRYTIPYKYDVRVNWSGAPLIPILEYSNYYLYRDAPTTFFDYIYGPQAGPTYTTGIISADFNFNIKNWFSFSIGAGVCDIYRSILMPLENNRQVETIHDLSFTIMAQARFMWLTSEWVRLYSSVGLGGYISDCF